MPDHGGGACGVCGGVEPVMKDGSDSGAPPDDVWADAPTPQMRQPAAAIQTNGLQSGGLRSGERVSGAVIVD